jgi:hypothetical protein
MREALMPYRVLLGKVAIECDSVDEAIEIAKKAGGDFDSDAAAREDKGTAAGSSRWTDVRIVEFFRQIKGQQRKVIDTLLQYHDGQTDSQLLQLLNMKSGKELAGVMTGLVKNARKVGADPKEIYERRPLTIGDERQHEYVLTEAFKKAVTRARGKV